MEDCMLKVAHLSKQYKLGQIGGTTLREEIQRWNARRHHKEDPTSIIGVGIYTYGEIFKALDDVSFEVKKGERVGIIGHNGAGKSTLLKLISRITAPSKGDIWLNGRVASMLEVGTGFHGELTGRENIYMNGAILGMKKREIDEKIEDIIDFSECRQFIDTPVKRYSSGMYVKLAFSVAAHLDAEIMIMDEVLAVGDMAFQKKCLEKMSDVSKTEGRTILYVSHNMNTIRQLCERCIVMDHGKVIYDGEVEEAISLYIGITNTSNPIIDLLSIPRDKEFDNPLVKMTRLEILSMNSVFMFGTTIRGALTVKSMANYRNCVLKIFLLHNGLPVMTSESRATIELEPIGENVLSFGLSLGALAPGKYSVKILLCQRDGTGGRAYLDVIMNSYIFEVIEPEGFHENQKWIIRHNGYIVGDTIEVVQEHRK